MRGEEWEREGRSGDERVGVGIRREESGGEGIRGAEWRGENEGREKRVERT